MANFYNDNRTQKLPNMEECSHIPDSHQQSQQQQKVWKQIP